jgi:hypothetical protein
MFYLPLNVQLIIIAYRPLVKYYPQWITGSSQRSNTDRLTALPVAGEVYLPAMGMNHRKRAA